MSEDGTLVIEPVQLEDAGEYVCKGLSIAGSAYAKARLEVKGEKGAGLLLFYFIVFCIYCFSKHINVQIEKTIVRCENGWGLIFNVREDEAICTRIIMNRN